MDKFRLCPNCKSPNAINSRFCVECQNQMPPANETSKPKRDTRLCSWSGCDDYGMVSPDARGESRFYCRRHATKVMGIKFDDSITVEDWRERDIREKIDKLGLDRCEDETREEYIARMKESLKYWTGRLSF